MTLRTLDCGRSIISADCACELILPAVRVNTSLRILNFYLQCKNPGAGGGGDISARPPLTQ